MLTSGGVLMPQWSSLKPAHFWLKTVQIHLRHFTITEVALREFVDKNIPHSIIIIEYSIIIPIIMTLILRCWYSMEIKDSTKHGSPNGLT